MKDLIWKVSIGFIGIVCIIMGYGFYTISNTDFVQQNKINNKGIQAEEYCKNNNMNTNFCILIDMSIHSGKDRFYVYDFKQKKVIDKFPVSHGCGNNPWGSGNSADSPTFSNIVDSHLSSLGKYAIGDRGWSSWGVNVNYKLHGLEKSNSNAYKRYIVFHSWDMISDKEIYPAGTAEGWGCPAISNNNFRYIDELLKNEKKPTLMWIYK